MKRKRDKSAHSRKDEDGIDEVVLDDARDRPWCKHGPALLFRRRRGNETEDFFACSAQRDGNCPLSSTSEDFQGISAQHGLSLEEILKLPESDRVYCYTCSAFALKLHHHASHSVRRGISDEDLNEPTRFLEALSNDTKEAQYFFDERALSCFVDNFVNLKMNKVICIGAPRLHEHLRNNFPKLKIRSILLDIDARFEVFLPSSQFFNYNMFNNHFFGGEEKQKQFQRFLADGANERTCLVTDPPFAARTEILSHTLRAIAQWYREANGFGRLLPVVWIFPYYMESYVRGSMPEIEMLDYKVNYTNHKTYHSGAKCRKQLSPVRIFTNIPANAIRLPASEGYWHCSVCKRWSASENKHCRKCGKCPAKNGNEYTHCDACDVCVKPFYKHCFSCRRCTQANDHDCDDYQKHQKCNICLRRGHVESNCEKWFGEASKSSREVEKMRATAVKGKLKFCFLCCKKGHVEQKCKSRQRLLSEMTFLGDTENILTNS